VTRLGGGAPRSERHSTEKSLPASVQWMLGNGLSTGSVLTREGEIGIGLGQGATKIRGAPSCASALLVGQAPISCGGH